MKTLGVAAGALLLLAGSVAIDQPAMAPAISIAPQEASVFTGSSIVLHATVRGNAAGVVRWSLIGPGALRPAGASAKYDAPNGAGARAVVVAAIGTVAAATDVRTVSPPARDARLVLVACFSGAAIDFRAADSLAPVGQRAVGGEVGGIALSRAPRRFALAVTRDHVEAIELSTMRAQRSSAEPSALLTSVAALARGTFAVTNANAHADGPGVEFFRIDGAGRPVRTGAVSAGETPEDVVAERDGRVFYVSNTNGNSVMRFSFDPRAGAKLTGIARTGTRPFGIAVDERGKLLFVADNDTPYLSGDRSRPGLEVFSLPSLRRRGAVIDTGTPNALPLGVAVDEELGRVFVTNEGDATVAVYALPALRRVATFYTGRTPWLPTIDTVRHRLLVPSARSDAVSAFDTRALVATKSFDTCRYPTAITIEARLPGPTQSSLRNGAAHRCTHCTRPK